jgi:sialate O-acetylesterase
MEMPISGFGFQEVEGATEAIMAAPETASLVRVFDIKTGKCTEPQADVDAVWAYTDGAVTAKTSAVAYFFGKRLAKTLGVPVGIIVNAWGGSRIEPWMTREVIDGAGLTQQELQDLYAVEEQPDRWPETPELIWNGRVKPIVGYAAKGILWYQGCSNMGQPHCYDKLQKAMVEMWRKEWGRELPFLFTLLAPHDHGDSDGRWRPFFVENQLHTEEILSQSWAICTETLGNKVTVHPSQKKEVGDMMVQRALQNVYGIYSGISIELPRLKEVTFEEGAAKVTLTQVWSNLMSISARDIVGFELAGEDRQFHLAQAQVDWDGGTILVSCPEVTHPIAVRYGWRNFMNANLQKSNGIPVPPFRSDDWEY